ncbi:MAG: phage major capsid protein [Balneola sp.]
MEEQLKRLIELRGLETPSEEEKTELRNLEAKLEKAFSEDTLTEDRVAELISSTVDRVIETHEEKKVEVNAQVKVKERAATEDAMYENTEQLLRGMFTKDSEKIADSQFELVRGGHFGEKIASGVTERAAFSTLTSQEGQVFLPTAISNQIFNIEKKYGTVTGNSLQLSVTNGQLKIPNVTGNLTFFAIAEGSEMKARGFSFGGVTLDPNQWGVLVPWTLKIQREAGARLLPIVMQKIGEASAAIKDEAFLSGDGTGTYHNIKGLSQRATDGDIAVQTAASGNTSFATVGADDYLDIQKQLPAGIRKRGIYVLHPDREYDLRKLKDNDGQYIYGGPKGDNDVPRLWGRPVSYTEKAPNTDGTSAAVGYYYVPDYLAYGVGMNLAADTLTEATITDIDDSTEIKLGAQYSAALRVVEEFDLAFGKNDGFAQLKTAAS